MSVPGPATPGPALGSLVAYAAWLSERVAAEPRPRIVLGHGIGGSIVLELLQRHADLVDGAILHAPVGTRLDRRRLPRLMALPGACCLSQRLLAARPLRPLWRRLLFSPLVPSAYLDRFFDEYGACSVFCQMFDLITPTWFRSLRPTERPAALLWGEAQRPLTIDQLEDYRALLPRVVVRRVPGWGHFPMIEQPAVYAGEIGDLARALVASAEVA